MRAEKSLADRQQQMRTRRTQIQHGQPLKPLTAEAKAYIHRLTQDPKVSPEELAGITRLLRENPEAASVAITKSLQSAQAQAAAHLAKHIKDARIAFTEKAKDYVMVHLNATRAAYAAGEFDTAARHAEWAMKNLGAGNLRLIEMPQEGEGGNSGPRIMVGVKIGGQQAQVIDADPE
jgi:phenylpyruvate tautomerase PptA (4-oxalocrotonate tautomerase family)